MSAFGVRSFAVLYGLFLYVLGVVMVFIWGKNLPKSVKMLVALPLVLVLVSVVVTGIVLGLSVAWGCLLTEWGRAWVCLG